MTTLPRIQAADPEQALDLCQSLLALVAATTEPRHLHRPGPAGHPASSDCRAFFVANKLVQHTLAHVQANG